MTHYDEIIVMAEKLTPAEKARLIEQVSASLKRDLESSAYKDMPWEEFVNLTYGSLSDDPIERGKQPPLDVRDEIE